MALRFSGFYGQVVLDLWIWRGATKIHPQTMEEGSSTTAYYKLLCQKEMGIPDHRTCLLRNLYAGQETS